ncbi:siphovirus Gp157 family protein [Sporolactobacillus kofuensis]|uniref:Siphovirus Gp157 family protein n=1 Tax=Sporolactobacillus kofuensis TaxID=269672 RepID=A0ABW1WDI6_9BACL|nr:siphovirus Gp157 family protein [Sporolactobacillus kofuensis]MCO7177044.1 siphovirus Gp157 family protein [Sporolactobacillus kofuensis]
MYDLTDKYRQLLDIAEDVDSDLLSDTLESIHDAIEVKAESTAAVIKEIEKDVTGLKSEIDRLTKRKQAYENNVKRLKQHLLESLEKANIQKVKGHKFTVSTRFNAPHAVITDENMIPVQFIKTVETIDKSGLTALLKTSEGKNVKGAYLQKTKSLQIR